MSSVIITVTPPGGSPQDITNSCIFSRCSFESQMNGVPGSFDIYVRDPDMTLDFVTGSEIRLTIDDVVQFGGYVTVVGMTNLAPAADTSDLDTYDLRAWHLSGSDYNIALDRRIYRDTGDYLTSIRINEVIDGQILTSAINNYTDMDDFSTSGIDDVATIPDIDHVTIQQGWVVRKEFETLLPFAGAVYYIDGDKTIVWKAYDNAEKRWGFSDNPNHNTITASPAEYQGATYGFSQVEASQDASFLSNDVFVWGGSEFAGSGGTVFHRSTDTDSIDDHGRWQHAETHFGESMYKSNAGVTAVANAILNGPPGTDATGQEKGLKRPQWMFSFTWFSDQVPLLSGVPDHIRAGDLVTINLSVFGTTRLLPVRTLRISFPDAFDGAPDEDDRLVQFDGAFGLQLSDSFTLWRYVLQNTNRVVIQTQEVVTDTSDSSGFGGYYAPSNVLPAPDGSTTTFTMPFPYILGTTQVFINGLMQRSGTDYSESNNQAGEITFTSAPLTTDTIQVSAYTLTGSSSVVIPAGSYYISPSGNDSTGDGSEADPWASFNKFLSLPPGPDSTLIVRGGTYTGSLNRNQVISGISGTAGHPITVRGYPGEFAIFDGEADGVSDFDRQWLVAYDANGTDDPCSHWVLRDLNLVNFSKDQSGIIYIGSIASTTRDWVVNNVNITKVPPGNTSSQMIYTAADTDGVVITNCVFTGTFPTIGTDGNAFQTEHGTDVGAAHSPKNIVVQYNVFLNCNKGIQLYGDDGSPDGSTVYIDHNTFIGCDVNIECVHYMSATVINQAGNTAAAGSGENLYDSGSGTLTASNNFWGQTFNGGFFLSPTSQAAYKAATDGTDAGARNT